jgi:hypothetical protein
MHRYSVVQNCAKFFFLHTVKTQQSLSIVSTCWRSRWLRCPGCAVRSANVSVSFPPKHCVVLVVQQLDDLISFLTHLLFCALRSHCIMIVAVSLMPGQVNKQLGG